MQNTIAPIFKKAIQEQFHYPSAEFSDHFLVTEDMKIIVSRRPNSIFITEDTFFITLSLVNTPRGAFVSKCCERAKNKQKQLRFIQKNMYVGILLPGFFLKCCERVI